MRGEPQSAEPLSRELKLTADSANGVSRGAFAEAASAMAAPNEKNRVRIRLAFFFMGISSQPRRRIAPRFGLETRKSIEVLFFVSRLNFGNRGVSVSLPRPRTDGAGFN
jgi:hypothetical protein